MKRFAVLFLGTVVMVLPAADEPKNADEKFAEGFRKWLDEE